MGKKVLLMFVATLVLFSLLVGIQAPAALAQGHTPLSGAIWTTNEDGSDVNKNLYDRKQDVFLNGGPKSPTSAGMTNGYYYIVITNPNGDVVLGRSWNYNSTVRRVVEVRDGWFYRTLENGSPAPFTIPVECWEFLFAKANGNSNNNFKNNGYADTPNIGGVYKVWACYTGDLNSNPDPTPPPDPYGFMDLPTKTDNFKVRRVNGNNLVIKTFKLTVPAILVEHPAFTDVVFSAWFSFTDPATNGDWDEVILLPTADPLVLSAQTEFVNNDIIWWKLTAEGTHYSWESTIHGPETLLSPRNGGPADGYINEETIPAVDKVFHLTVPAILVENAEFADVVFSAWYSFADPGTNGDWTEVVLTPADSTVFEGEIEFAHCMTIWWKFTAIGAHYSWESDVSGPEHLESPGPYRNEETIPAVDKIFRLTVPAILVETPEFADVAYRAWYSFIDPAIDGSWHEVGLAPVDGTVFEGEVEFADQMTIWWYFTASGALYSWESDLHGPETLEAPGPHTNPDTIPEVPKSFQLTVPCILVDHDAFADMEFTAWYTFTDPEGLDPTAWYPVVMEFYSKIGDTCVLRGDVLFADNNEVWWKFTAEGTYYSWESDVYGPETLNAPGPYTNPETIPGVLKTFRLTVPCILVDHDAFADVQFTAWYRFIDPAGLLLPSDWYSADLELYDRINDTCDLRSNIVFPDGAKIQWQFTAIGTYYSWESPVHGGEEGETLSAPGPYLNEETIPEVTKTWQLLVGPNIPGASYFAAWSLDNITWYDVPLTESSPGIWTADTVFPAGIEIYYKFYGTAGLIVFWESPVLGPETLETDVTNEYSFSMPRTIGYWKNWDNHFTNSTMDTIIGEVNSDANGFSIIFRAGTSDVAGDTGCYQLTRGIGGPGALPPDVSGYLQEHAAVLMYQMLRAQLLGVELAVATTQTGSTPEGGEMVGLSLGARVYLSKVSGYNNPSVNPWYYDTTTPTVGQVIEVVESAASCGDWSAWTPAMQEFAKNVLEAINQSSEGGMNILEP